MTNNTTSQAKKPAALLRAWFCCVFFCSAAWADFVYEYQANITDDLQFELDGGTYYYEAYQVTAQSSGSLSIINNAANLQPYNDPYVYVYAGPTVTDFENWIYEDDDGHPEQLGEGLFFYLPNVQYQAASPFIILISTYDEEATGTVDFEITSANALSINSIPEPQAIGLIMTAGAVLLLLKRKLIKE